MKILIVEDVTRVAQRIKRLTELYIEEYIENIKIVHSLDDAKLYFKKDKADLIFLDLNLNGKDGFSLLEEYQEKSCFTIVITANEKEAVRAFDLGIFDFITKPISKERFEVAMERLSHARKNNGLLSKYLTIKSYGGLELVELNKITHIKAAGHYSEIFTLDNKSYLYGKHLEKLISVLPNIFIRVHRSYGLNLEKIKKVNVYGGGKYEALILSGQKVPINRETYLKLLKTD